MNKNNSLVCSVLMSFSIFLEKQEKIVFANEFDIGDDLELMLDFFKDINVNCDISESFWRDICDRTSNEVTKSNTMRNIIIRDVLFDFFIFLHRLSVSFENSEIGNVAKIDGLIFAFLAENKIQFYPFDKNFQNIVIFDKNSQNIEIFERN